MSSSSIFSSKGATRPLAGILAALLVAASLLMVIDRALYGEKLFLRYWGPGTLEGQIDGKIRKARAFAREADVILFGSSYVRQGYATAPFLEHGLVPLNLGISGGGPLSSYFLLDEISGTLRGRAIKPVLVLEIHGPFLSSEKSKHAEFRQVFALVRDRRTIWDHFGPLYRHFANHGLSSKFLSHIAFPSFIYRQNNWNVALGIELVGGHAGAEDIFGFSSGLHIADRPFPATAKKRIRPFEEQILFVEKFVKLAAELGCRIIVVPITNPSSDYLDEVGKHEIHQAVASRLSGQIPDADIAVVPSAGLLPPNDNPAKTKGSHAYYDGGGHPNYWGGEWRSRRIIAILDRPPRANKVAASDRLAKSIHNVELPGAWELRNVGMEAGRLTFGRAAVPPGESTQALSAPLSLEPGRDYFLELEAHVLQGTVVAGVDVYRNGSLFRWYEYPLSASVKPGIPDLGPARYTVQFTAHTADVRVRFADRRTAGDQSPARGWVRIVRLVSLRQ